MSPDVIGWVLGGVLTALAGLLTLVGSRRSNRAKAKLDEVSAYSQMVADLRTEIERLNSELAELRQSVTTAQGENVGLRSQIARLQRTVDRMTRLLAEHNIPVPQET